MKKDEYQKKLKEDLISLCEKILESKSNHEIIQAVRKLADNIEVLNLSEEEENFLYAVESETEDIPVGLVREKWNKGALEKLDSEICEYIEEVLPQLREISKKIISKN